MPATVPSDCPKKWANGSPREKVGPNSKTGGMGYGATPMSPQKGERLDTWAQDVSKTHDATRYDGTSTSTTYQQGCTPAMGTGYGCSNGMDRATNCRDWQEPIDVKPQQSPKNEKLHSTWMNPYEPCGPEGQSEWHPHGIKAGSGCSYEKGAASDGNVGQKPALLQLGPPPTRELVRSKKEWNPHTPGVVGTKVGYFGSNLLKCP